jgi:branched-chain amino acid transport system ATP-binding protein
MSATTVLSATGLTKTFGGVRAVRGVDLEAAAGEIVALIGPNGAGKSTCFAMLGGQTTPDSGTVRVAGRAVTGKPPHALARAGVGRTFQLARVFGSMTVLENVQTACLGDARRGPGLWRRAYHRHCGEAEALLARVAMADLAGRPADTLAYGDIKRLELAMALAGDPVLLLMDEPTAGMAPDERAAFMRRVAAEARERRRAVLFTEHDMDVVFGHADRVLVMARGARIAQGPPEQVRADPHVRAVYLGDGSGAGDPAEAASC